MRPTLKPRKITQATRDTSYAPAALCFRGGVVDLHVEGRHQAEHDRRQRADERREEVVDAGPAAPEPIPAEQLVAEDDEQAHGRRQHQVLVERRMPLGRRNDAELETDEVGEEKRRRAGQGVERRLTGRASARVRRVTTAQHSIGGFLPVRTRGARSMAACCPLCTTAAPPELKILTPLPVDGGRAWFKPPLQQPRAGAWRTRYSSTCSRCPYGRYSAQDDILGVYMIGLLVKARVCHRVSHSHCSGLPLGADAGSARFLPAGRDPRRRFGGPPSRSAPRRTPRPGPAPSAAVPRAADRRRGPGRCPRRSTPRRRGRSGSRRRRGPRAGTIRWRRRPACRTPAPSSGDSPNPS